MISEEEILLSLVVGVSLLAGVAINEIINAYKKNKNKTPFKRERK